MYLSIGSDLAVRDSSIIGIFDLDNTSTSKRTVEFLEKAEEEGLVVPCDDLPKSFILTAEYGMPRVYLTEYYTSTLEKRLK
jgi:hypothetical protein